MVVPSTGTSLPRESEKRTSDMGAILSFKSQRRNSGRACFGRAWSKLDCWSMEPDVMTVDQLFCTECGSDNRLNAVFEACWYCGGPIIATETVEYEPEFVSEIFSKQDRLWWEASVASYNGKYSEIYQTVLPRNFTVIPRYIVADHWILKDPITSAVIGIIDDETEIEIFTEDA